MEDFIKAIGVAFMFAALLFVAPLLGATFGAFGGWVVGLVWGETVLGTLQRVGLPPEIAMWQLGCCGGFLGSFLRTSVSANKS